jgi:hypothetical protein
MGELIPFPKKTSTWSGVRTTYGVIVLEPWEHLLDREELIDRLIDESVGDGTISVPTFLTVCDDMNLGADTAGEVLLRLQEHGIFRFLE